MTRTRKHIALFLVFAFFMVFHPAHAAVVGQSAMSANSTLNQGLVGWWTMDGKDVVNGVVLDKSGNGNNGNPMNIATSTFYTQGKIGQAVTLNGTAQYVDVSSLDSYPNGKSSLSISLWAKWKGSQSNRAFAGWWLSKDNVIRITNNVPGNIQVGFTTASFGHAESDNSNYNDNKWHNIVGVYDGSFVSLYVDGVLAGPRFSLTGNLSSADKFDIGSINDSSAGTWNYQGSLDDVRIYNRALSASEITELYNMGGSKLATTQVAVNNVGINSGLVGYWTMDGKDIVSGKILDKSGNNNNGSPANIASSTFYTPGITGQAVNLNGKTNYIDVGTGSSLNISGAMTSCSWVYLRNIPNGSSEVAIVANSNSDRSFIQYSFEIESDYSVGIFWVDNGNIRSLLSNPSAVPRNKWTYICIARTASSGNIYINGQSVTTNVSSGSVPTSGYGNTVIGKEGSSPYSYFDGLIDSLRIYNRALSAYEITELYNMDQNKYSSTVTGNINQGINSGLLGWWTFDGKDNRNGQFLDRSGNGNNAFGMNGISTSTFYVQGKLGQGIRINKGVSTYVKIPATTAINNLSGNNPLTFSSWFNEDLINAQGTIIYIGSGPHLYLQINTDGKGQFGIYNGTIFQNASTTSAVTLKRWHLLTGTYDGNIATMYLDGVFQTRMPINQIAAHANEAVNIGGWVYGTRPFGGVLDDVRIYSRALSPQEVQALYNMGR